MSVARNVDFIKVHNEVKTLVSDIIEVPPTQLKDDASLTEDLGVDSMMALEIVANVEKKFKLHVPESKIPTIHCLNDVYSIVDTKFKSTHKLKKAA